ncbi:MAG: VOC family protein [Chloroflexota bacterium]
MAQLVPYLAFEGNCREAMTFYADCLGGKLTIQTFGEAPMAAGMPKEAQQNVMHSSLEKDGFMLMGADMMEPATSVHNNTVSLCLVCSSKDETETLFSKLSAGGNVTHPLKEEFFGTFGDFTDKYGFSWMVQYSPTPTP